MRVEWMQETWLWPAGAAMLALAAAAMTPRRSWRWRITGLILPLMAVLAIAMALAGPRIVSGRNDAVVVLLDLSESTRNSPWRDPAWVRQLIEARLGNRPVTVIGFAGGTRVLLDQITARDTERWPLVWEAVGEGKRSDMAAAMAWRAPGEVDLRPRWVISDGLLEAPSASKFPLAWTLVPPERLDAGIVDLVMRTAGEGIEILTQVRTVAPHHAGDLPVMLRIDRDGTRIAEEQIHFTPSPGNDSIDAARWISVIDRHADRTVVHRYSVSIQTAQDAWPENDAAQAMWVPPDNGRVLVVGTTPEGPLKGIPGTTFIPVERLESDLSRLTAEGWQVLLLDDILVAGTSDRTTLSSAQARMIDRFVRETGGGLFLVGRGHAFGPGHYGNGSFAGDTLEALSPLWSRPHTGSNLHVVFLLDASGSMNQLMASEGRGEGGDERKFRLLSRGVEESASMLSGDDRLTVITFNRAAAQLADGPAARVLPALGKALAAVAPTGETSPDTALPLLQASLRDDAATQRLVILVTDGEIPAMDAARWKHLLQTTPPTPLAIIAPPPHPASPLQQLAATLTDAVWLPTEDPRTWRTLLQQTLSQRVDGKLRNSPLPWKIIADRLPAATRPVATTGIANPWTETWLKPESTLLVVGTSSTGDPVHPWPLAAIAQRGLGQTAAMAMQDDSPAYRTLLADIIQQLAAVPGDRRFTLSTQKSPEGGWIIAADGADDHGFLNGQSLKAKTIAADGQGATVPLRQTGPGHYEARITGALAATVFRATSAQPAANPRDELVGRVRLPQMETGEWPASVQKPLIPAQLPAGSTLLPTSTESGVWNPPATGVIAFAPFFWCLGALAALAALWSRR